MDQELCALLHDAWQEMATKDKSDFTTLLKDLLKNQQRLIAKQQILLDDFDEQFATSSLLNAQSRVSSMDNRTHQSGY